MFKPTGARAQDCSIARDAATLSASGLIGARPRSPTPGGKWLRSPTLGGEWLRSHSGWSPGSQELLGAWSLGEHPRAKAGHGRPTPTALQPAGGRSWFTGDQDRRGHGPQGINFARLLVLT